MMTIHYLLAIYPFDTLELPLRERQNILFREKGWSSARMLPPVIPLVYLKMEPSPGKVRDLLRKEKPRFLLNPGKIIERGGALFLDAEEKTAELTAYRDRLQILFREYFLDENALPIPLFPGFFLCLKEDDSPLPDFPAIKEKNFSLYTTVFMILRRNMEQDCWWHQFEWEIVLSQKNSR